MDDLLAAVPLHSQIEIDIRFALPATSRGFWIVLEDRVAEKAIIRRDFPDCTLAPPHFNMRG